MSSAHADRPETWEDLLAWSHNEFVNLYVEDQIKQDFEAFIQLKKSGLLVLDYDANWRGISDWPNDESERGIPWLIFAGNKDAMTSEFVEHLRDGSKFQTTIWELSGCEPREPLYSDYFCKWYQPASDSESYNWTGMDSRVDDPELSLEAFKLDHLQFDVFVCEVGMKIDVETFDKMDSQTFYNYIKDMDLVGEMLRY